MTVHDMAAGGMTGGRVALADLARMRAEGRPILALVVWDATIAALAERAGAEILSVGDSAGVHLWGRASPLETTLDEMALLTGAVRQGAVRALVSADLPPAEVEAGRAVAAARRLRAAGADLVKLDDAGGHLAQLAALTAAGVPVWGQMGITPATARTFGFDPGATQGGGVEIAPDLAPRIVEVAQAVEAAGAVLLDLQNGGEAAGRAVAAAVRVPVLGGQGGGPWLHGRIRLAYAAIGLGTAFLDADRPAYAQTARTALAALRELAQDVRAGRHIRGQGPRA